MSFYELNARFRRLHKEHAAWREKNDYTLDDAAVALGISRRMVAYYERGNKPIPRLVALATRALSGMTIH